MAMQEQQSTDQLSIVKEIDIDAPAKTVWKAITDPKELVRWLPLQAKVKSGEGGSIWMSWGEPAVAESTIVSWKPNRHLSLKEIKPFGAPFEPKEAKSADRKINFYLEPYNGKTRLRLEHTGFGSKRAGEQSGPQAVAAAQRVSSFMTSVAACWDFQLNSLDVYATRHLGTDRTVAWSRAVSNLSFPETWKRVAGPQGIGLLREGTMDSARKGDSAPKGLRKGDRFTSRAASGDNFTGTVLTYNDDKQFAAVVENMNDSVLRVVLDHCGGRPEATVWLATYSSAKKVAAVQEESRELSLFEQRWNHTLQNVLA
jgi:uncharacterized protein YndB with AHSA1/START domain